MFRLLLLLSLASASLTALGQDKDIRITPAWILGDTRVVRTTVNLRMHLSDSMDMKESSTSSFHLSVRERRKDGSKLSISFAPEDLLPRMEVDMTGATPAAANAMIAANAPLKHMNNAVEGPMHGLVLDYNVGLKGDLIGPVQDDAAKEKLLDALATGAGTYYSTVSNGPKFSKPQIYHLCDSMRDDLAASLENEMSLLLDGYQYAYPAKGSKREPMQVKDVQAPMFPDIPELPAMVEYGFDEISADRAVCRVVFQYDQKALRAALVKEGQKVERLDLSEERVYTFDRRSGWLISASQAVTLVKDQVRVNMVTRSDLSPK